MAQDLGADNFILQMRALQSQQDQRETLKAIACQVWYCAEKRTGCARQTPSYDA